MSWVLAAIYERFMHATEAACLGAWRAELLAPLAGEVLEVGAGTGANLAHYPPSVTRLVLAEPDRHMRARLARKLGVADAARVELSDAAVERLPFAAARFDAVVSTLVLCSVADLAAALDEIRRVLKPGGKLIFIEHVAAAPDSGRWRWQRSVEPLWRRVMGNCHLTRRTEEAIGAAGFTVETARRESMRKAMPVVRPTVRGVARS
jgi:ubiquinone/menaquinone biosynthesis C-methylase UbiE